MDQGVPVFHGWGDCDNEDHGKHLEFEKPSNILFVSTSQTCLCQPRPEDLSSFLSHALTRFITL
jgi:hypothetical protein